jgi:hypothetical protein
MLTAGKTEVDESSGTARDAFLEAAITLNKNRIFCRLRSRHAKLGCNFKKDKQRKPKIASQLADAVKQIPTAKDSTYTDITSLVANVKAFQDLSNELESLDDSEARAMSGFKIILSITEKAYQMSREDVLGQFLRRSKLDSKSIKRISATVTKLGRYVSSSLNLLRAAREYTVFASISVQVIRLPPPPRQSYKDSDSLTDRLSDRFAQNGGKAKIISCLQPPKGASKAWGPAEVETELRQLATLDCAVHAEIQLLFHYSVTKWTARPRVICSTKKACYLCNLFFQLDGTFFIPNSHGRLYEKWVIPELTVLPSGDGLKRVSSVIVRFNRAIDDEIRYVIANGKKAYPYPLESIFFRSAIWSAPNQSRYTSTPSLISVTKRAIQVLPSVSQDLVREVSKAFSRETLVHGLNFPPSLDQNQDSPVRSPATVDDYILPAPPSHCSDPATAITHPPSAPCNQLERGMSVQIELSAMERPVRVETRRIHLTLSYPRSINSALTAFREQSGRTEPNDMTERFLAVLKWLDPHEQALRLTEQTSNLVDLDSVRSGSEILFDQYSGTLLAGLYLVRGKDMIFIKCWKE